MSEKTMGQVAFEAYRAEVVTAYDGKPIPEWDALDNGAPARRGWEAAALAVIHQHMMNALPTDTRRDFREERETRWRPISATPLALLAEVESLPPGVKFEPLPPIAFIDYPAASVPVDVEPDSDRD